MNIKSILIKLILTILIIFILSFIVAIGIILVVSINSQCDRISVVGIDGDHFSYGLKNTSILMTGATYEFKAKKSKEEVFKGLAESFPVFKESDDRIQIIERHQIFTVKYLGKYHFILYDETIWFETKDGSLVIPFPTDQLEKKDENRFNSNFYINCDIDYLKKFYSYYENIDVEKQNIIIKNAAFTSNTAGNSSVSKTVTLEIKGKEVLVSIS